MVAPVVGRAGSLGMRALSYVIGGMVALSALAAALGFASSMALLYMEIHR